MSSTKPSSGGGGSAGGGGNNSSSGSGQDNTQNATPSTTKTVNKVVFGGETLIDLSSDTVTSSTLLSGYKAHDKNGKVITGTMENIKPSSYSKDIYLVNNTFESGNDGETITQASCIVPGPIDYKLSFHFSYTQNVIDNGLERFLTIKPITSSGEELNSIIIVDQKKPISDMDEYFYITKSNKPPFNSLGKYTMFKIFLELRGILSGYTEILVSMNFLPNT